MSTYLNSVSILIVDERHFIRSIVRQILNALGCNKIFEAKNAEEAWEMAVANRPDIVITCWEMKPSNGLDLTRRFRSDPDTPNQFMPIIMMTSYAEYGRVIEARDAGISEYVIKPLSAKGLFRRLRSVIEYPRVFVRTKSYFGPDRRRKSLPVANERRNTDPEGLGPVGKEATETQSLVASS